MAFFNRMRDAVRPLSQMDGSSGGVGQSDSLSKLGSLNVLQKLLNMGGPSNRIGSISPRANPRVNPYGRAVDPTKGPMNVVYDQGPEQFAKQMKSRERALDIEEKKADAFANLKLSDLDVKRQNADTNLLRAQTTDRVRDLTDEEKAVAAFQKAMEVERARQEGANRRTDTVVGGRAAEGEANRKFQGGEGDKNRSSREATTKMTVTGAMDRQNDAQNFQAGQPGPLAGQLKSRIEQLLNEDPRFRNIVTWDDEAKGYAVAPPKTGGLFGGGDDAGTAALRAEFNRRIYGPQNVQVGNQPGVGNQSNLNPAVTGTQGQVQPRYQTNARTGQKRMSIDGGRTWTPVQ